ncbi:MAG: DEAD/DEAH box helicase [Nanoarchaeota archaeon]
MDIALAPEDCIELADLKEELHPELYKVLAAQGIKRLLPSQHKSIDAGLFDFQNLLVCTPTASGKTLVAEMAALNSILNKIGKAVYIVPLKALASEKFKEFRKRYGHLARIGIAVGDTDSPEERLKNYDLIFMTSEKMDSILRHHAQWIRDIKVLVVDEIHLLNDPGRGPTLEILITLMRRLLSDMQLIGLSATIGNAKELAEWLEAHLILDTWRPTELHQGIYLDGRVEFQKD